MRRRPSRRASGRARRENGAALVEFAFVAPLLFLILFGIIEFGFNFNNFQAVRQGTREGARQAVVDNNTSSCTSTVSNTSGKAIICTTRARVADGGVKENSVKAAVRVQVPATPSATNGYGQLVVCSEYPLTSFSGFFSSLFSGKYLQSRIQMKVEKALSTTDFPPGATTSYLEADPSGASWSWCTAPS